MYIYVIHSTCVCICIHTYIYICMYMYTHKHTHTHTHTHTRTHTHTHYPPAKLLFCAHVATRTSKKKTPATPKKKRHLRSFSSAPMSPPAFCPLLPAFLLSKIEQHFPAFLLPKIDWHAFNRRRSAESRGKKKGGGGKKNHQNSKNANRRRQGLVVSETLLALSICVLRQGLVASGASSA